MSIKPPMFAMFLAGALVVPAFAFAAKDGDAEAWESTGSSSDTNAPE